MIEIVHRYTRAVIYRSEADAIGAAAKEALASRAVLMGAVLTDAVLRGADLRGADLTGAVLRGAVLTGCNCGTALGDLLRITGSRHAIIAVDEDNISIGCMRHDLVWWREHYAATGRAEKYSDAQVEEYRLHIEYVAQWFAARKATQ